MSLNFHTARRAFLNLGLVTGLALLTACGGGLGSTSDDELSIDTLTWSPSAPTSGVPVSAVATVSYSGTITSSDISYAWTQTSGPSVTLVNSTAATVYFTAPTVSTSSEIVLTLTVSANDVSALKSVTITVSP
ncbi:hypothetical protein Q9Q94_12010 [Uliginosibacterium sp. 31-16]|uniref:PKD domain-containing protein n=1 Tax=Uliginosibacterium sp. 31-16 TaxID=3068315 RepID=UPI00273EF802|nr:hypothetical protein [Uliginosibacterium sp. 31-16]MDP5240257.1 hypothetical protein [Uliginosibacterium sp. 31-16]